MTEDSEFVEFRQPHGMVTINWCLYVHGVGFTMRAMGVPSAEPDEFLEWLQETGQRCEHSLPAIWIFQGYFPDKHRGKVFIHVTSDMHEVAAILRTPKQIRLYGTDERAPLVPVDPVTGSAADSVREFNNWVGFMVEDEERQDFSVLSDVDFDSFEDMLKRAAEGGTSGE